MEILVVRVCFFFQAEDGIRFLIVTGVQTCALPICSHSPRCPRPGRWCASWRSARLPGSMRLIGLTVALTLSLLAAPLAAQGQQTGKVYRIGLISVTHGTGEEAFFERLRELGYVQGQNLVIERRYSEGR